MDRPETAEPRPSFDYEALEKVLAALRNPESDKSAAARKARSFFDGQAGESMKVEGDAERYVTSDGQLKPFDGIYKMPYREVQIAAAFDDGVAVHMHDETFIQSDALPILLYETIDPVPPGGLDEVPSTDS